VSQKRPFLKFLSFHPTRRTFALTYSSHNQARNRILLFLPIPGLGTSPRSWLNLQALSDLRWAEQEHGDEIRTTITPRNHIAT
jgi:hypothetical protein